jgi:hypothetical protein
MKMKKLLIAAIALWLQKKHAVGSNAPGRSSRPAANGSSRCCTVSNKSRSEHCQSKEEVR